MSSTQELANDLSEYLNEYIGLNELNEIAEEYESKTARWSIESPKVRLGKGKVSEDPAIFLKYDGDDRFLSLEEEPDDYDEFLGEVAKYLEKNTDLEIEDSI